MGPPAFFCRTCDHYRRRHVGGPGGYGACAREPIERPVHANGLACAEHPGRRPPPTSKTHELKTWPAEFAALSDGRKRFEFRRDDGRGFAVGDVLWLREFAHDGVVCGVSRGIYTGRGLRVRVTYVLRGPDFGVPPGFAVLSIAPEGGST